MAKLSKQLQNKDDVSDRPTRTQKVGARQQYESEKREFEGLREQAKKIREEKFKDQVVDGKTIPFVLEDTGDADYSYKDVFETLSPELKQFFDTPEVVVEQKHARIKTTKQTVAEKSAEADQRIADLKVKYAKKEQDHKDWWRRKSSKYRHDQDNKDDYHENLDEWEDELEERIAEQQGYKKGLVKGKAELDANRDVDFKSIEEYAWDLGQYEQDKKQARNERRAFEKDQKLERRRLEEAGYKPQLIQEFFKGNPQGAKLHFYNPTTKDWKLVEEYDYKGSIDVSKLTKLGYSAPQERSVSFGGKDYKFKSGVGIYKDSAGNLKTPYQDLNVTEAGLIKQQQDFEIAEWKKDRKISVPFKTLSGKDLPLGYGGQQTRSVDGSGNVITPSVIMTDQDYYRDVKGIDFGVGKVWGGVKNVFGYVDDRVHWDFSVGGSPSMPKLSLVKFGKIEDPTIAEKYIEKGVKGFGATSQNIEEWAIGKNVIEDYNKEVETKYQDEYQTRFDNKYMEDLIRGEVEFETASKEFGESGEAKILQKKYTKEYGIGYKQLQTDVGFWKGTAGGVAQTGVSLGSLGLKVVSSPLKTAVTVGTVYTGVKALAMIPKGVSLGLSTGFGVYGAYKFIDPSSTYIERGGGLVTLSIAGATLGYAGYKHLGSPVVKTVKIKAPKMSLKSSGSIGKDIKIITNKGMINKIIFENQKLSQYAQAGRRTIVTTKGRLLANKFWDRIGVPKKLITIDSNAIYRGVPTQQLARSYTLHGLRGSYKTTFGVRSGYENALLKLTKYGYSPTQAKSTLRYFAPKITEQYMGGSLTIKGTQAVGQFEVLTKQPIISVDKSLGIKTRGAKTIKDIYDVERKLILFKDPQTLKTSVYALQGQTRIGTTLTKAGKLFKFKDYDAGVSVIKSKAGATQKGYEYLGKNEFGIDIWKKNALFKDIKSISNTQKLFPFDKSSKIAGSNTRLYQKIIDLRDTKGTRYIGGKKTPFSVTFTDKIDDFAIKNTKIKATGTDITKLMDKIDDISMRNTGVKASKYAGSGQYEKTFGGLDLKTFNQQQLKVGFDTQPIKTFELKDIIKVKHITSPSIKIAQLGQFAVLKNVLKPDLKFDNKFDLKSNLKVDNLLKIDLKQSPALKSNLKTTLKSQLKTTLDLAPPITTTLKTPTFKQPVIPNPTIPTRAIIFPFLKNKIQKKRKKKGGKGINEFAFMPDFTSRSLGLTQDVNVKNLMKKIKKVRTGLEIRRGVKVKWQ